ncbi:MAG: chromate efflux transporter [Rhodobacteraceae bacterium]|nr:chromate efflux transporter [Paracoccaceae bacterium]
MTPTPDLLRVFGRIGLLSFGGPAAQIAVMHRELVEERPWLTEKEFLNALSFCMLLPGPEAMQLATYAGWKLRGVAGGLLAGSLFVLPGALVIAALALLYTSHGTQPATQAALLGIKATVIVIVGKALWTLGQKALSGPAAYAIALAAFAAIFLVNLPFPAIIAIAALWGWMRAAPIQHPPTAWPQTGTSVKTIAVWVTLWLSPLAVLWFLGHEGLFEMAAFFAQLAVVTFGGAYAVLAYMTQEVVTTQGWLTTGQMVDALGLAETTPGPLILVTQFVGMITGYSWGGTALALGAGLLTLWMTFVPCFLWIFAGAPYVEHVLGRPRLQGALQAITAAVVGVILNLSVWFALHVYFTRIVPSRPGALSFPQPDIASFDPTALGLTGLAAVLMLWLRCGPILTLCVTATSAWVLSLI